VPGSAQAIEHSGLAIASMVLGIVGLFTSVLLVGVLPSIAAVIAGHFAQRRSPDSRAFWLTGLITGYVGIGAAVLFLLVFAVPFMLWVFANGQNSYLFNRYRCLRLVRRAGRCGGRQPA
jgi:O-antigen/teichoic acid export membrane protein